MKIPVVAGVGIGSTLLSAFDDALHECGVYNYNLIPLSSVIPPGTDVTIIARYTSPPEEHGHKLYVVKADMRSDRPGEVIAAGVGWYQWGDGRGVFVEHEAAGSCHETVAADMHYRICHSLRDLCAARGIPFREQAMRSKVAFTEVGDQPTSVLMLAVYQSEGWLPSAYSQSSLTERRLWPERGRSIGLGNPA